MPDPDSILEFWLDEVGPENWYKSSKELDQQIRDRFLALWEDVAREGKAPWGCDATGALAFVILMDQFPRNMFRGSGKAFSTDALARAKAKVAIEKRWDMRIEEPARQFFYLPLMHSECLGDQERCVRLMMERMKSESNLLHARAHREVIRRFGRFPHRNEDLGRHTTSPESAYFEGGGYGGVVRDVQAA